MSIATEVATLAQELRAAAAAHHEYEKQYGKDVNWPEWYASYIITQRDVAVQDALKMPR